MSKCKRLSPKIVLKSAPRFLAKINKTDYCWLWTSAKLKSGYGVFGAKGSSAFKAHRFSFYLFRGFLPSDLLVLHKCDIKACVNPDHLYLGTPKDNTRDIWQRGNPSPLMLDLKNQTSCQRGHEFNLENTIRTKSGRRACRICRNVSKRKSYRKLKDQFKNDQ